MCSSDLYKTPKIFFDNKNFKGRPFLYFAYGASVSEVIIDTLTGENKLIRVDILHDVGNSINSSIDIGQIEGGYVQGLGWLTNEEISWNSKGQILTHSPSTYKIPVSNDIPEKFYVKLYKKGMNKENVVIGKYCPWEYQGRTFSTPIGGCTWPANGSVPAEPNTYAWRTANDEPLLWWGLIHNVGGSVKSGNYPQDVIDTMVSE